MSAPGISQMTTLAARQLGGDVPDAISWGDVRIAAVIDWAGEVPDAIGLLPGTSRADWERHRDWLSGTGLWDPVTNRRALSVHSWVLQADGMTVVVDTGAGNGKDRPEQPLFAGLSTAYLANLARAGIQPEDVDVVINTHLHADHVGWNTRADNGHWTPTFPNARYVLPGPDVEYWDRAGGHASRLAAANRNVFEDSVRPVIDSRQADIWPDTHHRIGRRLTLHSAPGHTPGSSVLIMNCGGPTALFTGDLFHSPLQVIEPHWASCYDEEAGAAEASRRRVLSLAADTAALVLPAHLPGARALLIDRHAAGFQIARWFLPDAHDTGPAAE
jgi:glyoxylase-like metal-dependent hydrolase (beta-lactamase superfamily II)